VGEDVERMSGTSRYRGRAQESESKTSAMSYRAFDVITHLRRELVERVRLDGVDGERVVAVDGGKASGDWWVSGGS
jgi:hypothetical protein